MHAQAGPSWLRMIGTLDRPDQLFLPASAWLTADCPGVMRAVKRRMILSLFISLCMSCRQNTTTSQVKTGFCLDYLPCYMAACTRHKAYMLFYCTHPAVVHAHAASPLTFFGGLGTSAMQFCLLSSSVP